MSGPPPGSQQDTSLYGKGLYGRGLYSAPFATHTAANIWARSRVLASADLIRDAVGNIMAVSDVDIAGGPMWAPIPVAACTFWPPVGRSQCLALPNSAGTMFGAS